MKTKILSLIAISVVVLGLTTTTYAATANNDNYTVLSDISTINKIEVYGNVELYVSDASSDQVKVYNKYYSESALVQSKNGVLRISSYKAEKLVVWVSANDLRAISAYDNAVVKSFGDISKIEFNVDLHDNASAKLNLNAYNADVTVKDNAKIALNGSVEQYNLTHNLTATVNNNNVTSKHFTENKIIIPAGNDDLAGL